jgi:hypothetical protein
MPNFIHSYPFLAVLPSVQARLNLFSPEGTDAEHLEGLYAQTILLRYFPNPGDIMQMQWLVGSEWWELPREIQDTIWLQTMIHNGYYDGHVGRARRQFLVNITNDAAYSFLVRNSRHVGVVSDDTLIKMTALYAAMQFNREISRFGTQVYPHYFTISDLTVRDILQSSILQGSDRFVFYDMNLIHNVYVTRGIPGMISLLFVAMSMAAVSLVNTFVFPVLYFASVIIIMIFLLMRRNIGSVLLAGLKVIILSIGVNIVSTAIFAVYRNIRTVYDIHILAVLLLATAVTMIILLVKTFKSINVSNAPAVLSVEGIIEKRKNRVPRKGRI